MTTQYQIKEYINRNIFKGSNELGEIVWNCIDLREGDTFQCSTKKEAVDIFVNIWDTLSKEEKNRA